MSAAFNPVEKFAHTRISLDFFLIYTVWAAHSLNSTYDDMPIFNFILSPVTVRAVLLFIFIIGLFNFLQVCKFIIDRSEPESNWNITDLFSTYYVCTCYVFTNDFIWLVLAFCMSDSVFNYFSVSTLWNLMFEFIAVLTFFCRIGTVLGLMYFSTAVASAGFFFLRGGVTSLPVLKFWVIIFFLSFTGEYDWDLCLTFLT